MAQLEVLDCSISKAVNLQETPFGLECKLCQMREGGNPVTTTIGKAVEGTVHCSATVCLKNLKHQQASSRKG